jgi:hypothetical protein
LILILKSIGRAEKEFYWCSKSSVQKLWSFFRTDAIYLHSQNFLDGCFVFLTYLTTKLNELNTELQGEKRPSFKSLDIYVTNMCITYKSVYIYWQLPDND